MPFIPTNANDSAFYRLLAGSLTANGYENLSQFFEREFTNYFNNAEWKSIFGVADESLDNTFSQIVGKNKRPVIAAYVSYDADGPKISNEGFSVTRDSMPRMKLRSSFTEKAVLEEKKFMDRRANVAYDKIFKSFTVDAADLIRGIHNQISYTAYQIESTGKFIDDATNSIGLKTIQYDFRVPTGNKKKCGFGSKGVKKAWSDPDANPIGDLLDMVKYAKGNNILLAAGSIFRMNDNTWQTFIDHPNVRKAVNIAKYPGISSENSLKVAVLDDDVRNYMKGLRLPPVEIVDSMVSIPFMNPSTQEMEHIAKLAFADNTVLLRKGGLVGEVQWMAPVDAFATTANPMYTTEGGKIGVQQIIDSRAKAAEYQAEFTGIPVPFDVTSMMYLDTSAAEF